MHFCQELELKYPDNIIGLNIKSSFLFQKLYPTEISKFNNLSGFITIFQSALEKNIVCYLWSLSADQEFFKDFKENVKQSSMTKIIQLDIGYKSDD